MANKRWIRHVRFCPKPFKEKSPWASSNRLHEMDLPTTRSNRADVSTNRIHEWSRKYSMQVPCNQRQRHSITLWRWAWLEEKIGSPCDSRFNRVFIEQTKCDYIPYDSVGPRKRYCQKFDRTESQWTQWFPMEQVQILKPALKLHIDPFFHHLRA